MHGRVKVKTTAEQQEEKRKERQKKLKLFQNALGIAFKKIKLNEYDDVGMNITKKILAANSDYTTMWNYRKNALKCFKENRSPSQSADVWKKELVFVETCLRNNPKSYGCWNQRCFVMLEMSHPDWDCELHLTDLFLQLDDRNFHCWDYRRFLVKKTSRSPIKEINLTNSLIENNFSNYSSWHYRSKLLPKVFPSNSTSSKIAEEKLIEELELVQNAFFTDPNDQSAWFYHRWLLGRRVLLTMVLLMKAISPSKYRDEIVENLLNLNEIDPKRALYYRDLQSRYRVEDLIVSCDFSERRADLSGNSLTRLCHIEFLAFVTFLNLSDNELMELSEIFSSLHSLEILKVDRNQIRSISGLHGLTSLREIDLRHNNISSQHVLSVLSTCPSLHFVDLVGNPMKEVVVNDETKNYTFDVDIPMKWNMN